MFDNFDADGSGDLDHGELREGLKHAHLNLRPEDIAKFVAYADRDSGGTIDIDEFMAHFATPDYGHPQGYITQGGGTKMLRAPLEAGQEVKMQEVNARLGAALSDMSWQAPTRVDRAFGAHDYRADSRITVDELGAVLRTLNPGIHASEVAAMLPEARTKDNKLRFINYKQLMSHASERLHPLGGADQPKIQRRPEQTISSLKATSTRLLESAELAKHHHSISVPGRYTSTPSAPRPTSASDFKLMPCCCWVFGSM